MIEKADSDTLQKIHDNYKQMLDLQETDEDKKEN
jgi:hypothetical protein